MTDRPSIPPPPPTGWGFPEPAEDDPFRDAGAPPHVDEVLGGSLPSTGTKKFEWSFRARIGPRPEGGETPSDYPQPFRKLDGAFPPHSRARLVLFLVLTPIVALIAAFAGRGEGGLLQWVFVTLSATAIMTAAWTQARSQATKRNVPGGTEAMLPETQVLAAAGGGSTLGHILTPFLVAFLLLAGMMLALDGSAPLMTLGVAAAAAFYFGLLWHLRGSIAGLALASLGVGAVVAVGFGFIAFVGSLWGSDSDYNFWLYWLGSSSLAAPFIWRGWRLLRDFHFTRPTAIVAGILSLLLIAFVAVSARTGDYGRASSEFIEQEWAAPGGAAPAGAPTQEDAAARFFAAWRFGNRAGAERVASGPAVDSLFAIEPTRRDRFLGCGLFEGGQFTECRVDSAHGGLLTLGWQSGGEGMFWIDYVSPVP